MHKVHERNAMPASDLFHDYSELKNRVNFTALAFGLVEW